jgi:hypothetical protein
VVTGNVGSATAARLVAGKRIKNNGLTLGVPE